MEGRWSTGGTAAVAAVGGASWVAGRDPLASVFDNAANEVSPTQTGAAARAVVPAAAAPPASPPESAAGTAAGLSSGGGEGVMLAPNLPGERGERRAMPPSTSEGDVGLDNAGRGMGRRMEPGDRDTLGVPPQPMEAAGEVEGVLPVMEPVA